LLSERTHCIVGGTHCIVYEIYGQLLKENMSLKIFAGDFKSGRVDLDGFHLELCNGQRNPTEFIPLSYVQTLERFENIREVMSREEWVGSAQLDLETFSKLMADKMTYVPFIVRFKDDRKMVALIDQAAGSRSWTSMAVRRIWRVASTIAGKHSPKALQGKCQSPKISEVITTGIHRQR
jgi:hypothetical protein